MQINSCSYLFKRNAILLQDGGRDESHLVPQKSLTILGTTRKEPLKKKEQIDVVLKQVTWWFQCPGELTRLYFTQKILHCSPTFSQTFQSFPMLWRNTVPADSQMSLLIHTEVILCIVC